jgi:hypothetical protein
MGGNAAPHMQEQGVIAGIRIDIPGDQIILAARHAVHVRNDINVVGGAPAREIIQIDKARVDVITVGGIIIGGVGDLKEQLVMKGHPHGIKAIGVE